MSRRRGQPVEKRLVCALVNPLLPQCRQSVAGSVTHRASCGHTVWISPQGLPLLESGATVLCTACVDLATTEIKTVVPGAAEAFAAEWGVGAADQVLARLRDEGFELDPERAEQRAEESE